MTCSYLHRHINDPSDLRATVDRAINVLRTWTTEFDTIVCRGVSGLLVASPVAIALNKKLVIVCKTVFDCHSCDFIYV